MSVLMFLAMPRPGHLPKTGPVDWIDHYHAVGIGSVLRQRLRWMLRALPRGRSARMLEIGWGSGIFQEGLPPGGAVAVGLDIQELLPTVRSKLAEDGLPPALARADGVRLPF